MGASVEVDLRFKKGDKVLIMGTVETADKEDVNYLPYKIRIHSVPCRHKEAYVWVTEQACRPLKQEERE